MQEGWSGLEGKRRLRRGSTEQLTDEECPPHSSAERGENHFPSARTA